SFVGGGLLQGKFDARGYFLGMGIGGLAGMVIAIAPGMAAGAINGALQAYAANPNVSPLELVFSVTLGAVFGGMNPLGAVLGLTGSVIGGITANQLGYDWKRGVQIGGMLGDIAGTGVA